MNELIRKLRDDPEIHELKKKCHDLTGRWIPYHWDCFRDIDAYKDYMRKVIKEHDTTGQ